MEAMKKMFANASLVAIVLLSGLMSGCGSDSAVQPAVANAEVSATTATLLYTSDAHYGIKRSAAYAFKGYSGSQQVNSAMVAVMNTMPSATFPSDSGVNAGKTVGNIDFVIQGGDIANRMQKDAKNGYTGYVQSAYDSWKQFESGFINTLKFPTLLFPGNHDVSNAIGYANGTSKALSKDGITPDSFDGSVLAFIYNKYVKSGTFDTSTKAAAQASYTNATYQDATNKVYYSKDIAGVHFMFISMWPDLDAQAWMEVDLAKISSTTPAVIMTHDEPNTEAKHLTDPGGPSVWGNSFENLLVNVSPTTSLTAVVGPPAIAASDTIAAQRTFVRFLQRHKNIIAYFHGNTNYNDLGTCDNNGVKLTGSVTNATGCYKGPDPVASPVYLPWFRVDSPMKGEITGQNDATKAPPAGYDVNLLSYHVISIDSVAKKMTVREYRWNTATPQFGNDPTNSSVTIPLTPRIK